MKSTENYNQCLKMCLTWNVIDNETNYDKLTITLVNIFLVHKLLAYVRGKWVLIMSIFYP